MSCWHNPEKDGPIELWHFNIAATNFREKKYVEAYHRLFQCANSRLQKFFMSIGTRIHHENTRDYGINTLFDEALRMNLSYDGILSLSSVLDKGWESAKRHYHHSHHVEDPTKIPLDNQEQWDENFKNVEHFLKAMDMVSENQELKDKVVQSLITDVPANIGYQMETWVETFENKKYTINHHFNMLRDASYYNVNY